MINGSNIIKNGAINIEVTKQNKMPAFFGPFDPRKKIPAGDNKNTNTAVSLTFYSMQISVKL